jgi:hypothetical protein
MLILTSQGTTWVPTNVDMYADLGRQCVLKCMGTSFLQDVVTKTETDKAILVDPKDRSFKVNSISGSLVARQDRAENPERFCELFDPRYQF